MTFRSFCVVLAASMLIGALNSVGNFAKPAEAAPVAPALQASPSPTTQTSPITPEVSGQASASKEQTEGQTEKRPEDKEKKPEDKQEKPEDKTKYSSESVWLVAGVLLLLLILFALLLWWSNSLEQTSYLGVLYRETVEGIEYSRLAVPITEKSASGGYREDIEQDSDWLEANPQPPRPPELTSTPPGYRSSSPTDEERRQVTEATEKYLLAKSDYDPKNQVWEQKVEGEKKRRYRNDLAEARKKAQERADRAAGVNFAVLRGRGAEFVLEFTTIVVIIFAATALGILKILETQQIGTLLAAIAGYVLGRATTRTRSDAGEKAGSEEEKRMPVSTRELKELIEVVAGITRPSGQPPKPEPEGEAGSQPDKKRTGNSNSEQGNQNKTSG